jgi:hypothetical protein
MFIVHIKPVAGTTGTGTTSTIFADSGDNTLRITFTHDPAVRRIHGAIVGQVTLGSPATGGTVDQVSGDLDIGY